jgi:hypothetical protein
VYQDMSELVDVADMDIAVTQILMYTYMSVSSMWLSEEGERGGREGDEKE